MNILEKIIARKREEISEAKAKISINRMKDSELFHRKKSSLRESIKKNHGIIAEFKRKSPSKGIINTSDSLEKIISVYEQCGASAISVLTDRDFFGGSREDILQARKSVKIPLLRKDFMIDEYQFYEAKAWGADVVLLIASCLCDSQIREFSELAHELDLEVLLEIHNEEELKYFGKNIDFVGINNRDLRDFSVNLQNSVNLKNLLPKGVLSIAESGINSVNDFNFLRKNGFDAFLIGEFFMKNENPSETFKKFMKEIDEII